MSYIYVVEHGATVGINVESIVVTKSGTELAREPKYTVNGISMFGQSQVTTQCLKFCMENGIRVSFFNSNGKFYGTVTPAYKTDISCLKKQMIVKAVPEFRIRFAREIVSAKINNQAILAKRYACRRDKSDDQNFLLMKNAIKKVAHANRINELMGYEGQASKSFFSVISAGLPQKFRFSGRSRRPAKDPVNAQLC